MLLDIILQANIDVALCPNKTKPYCILKASVSDDILVHESSSQVYTKTKNMQRPAKWKI
jgi:hypothetical protein